MLRTQRIIIRVRAASFIFFSVRIITTWIEAEVLKRLLHETNCVAGPGFAIVRKTTVRLTAMSLM